VINLSPNYTPELILFYGSLGLIFAFLFAVKTSSVLMGLILGLSIILVGSEYWEVPIFVLSYLQMFSYEFPAILTIINHLLMVLIFGILACVAQIKANKQNIVTLSLGPVLTAILFFGFHVDYLARVTGLSILFMVTLDAISMRGFESHQILNVKDYYIQGEKYDWVSDPKWLEKIFHSRREKQTMKIINQYAPNSDILDVGCGTGRITRNLEGNVIGLDINEWNIERAKVNAPNARFVVGDCEDMRMIPSNSYDLVVFTETLEHIPNPQRALQEVKRVLRVGGITVITVPSQSLIWRFRKYLTTTHPHSEPFHHNFSKDSFLELLKKDFKVLEFKKIVFGLTLVAVALKVD